MATTTLPTSTIIDIPSLRTLFEPASVAIIGASSDRNKIGGRPIHNMKLAAYKGQLYPINPNAPEIQGVPAYPSIKETPGPVDMAVIVVPQERGLVEPAIADCIEKGVKTAIILSSGFAEIDEAGAKAQDRIAAMAKEGGLRVLGPNCMGTMNANNGMIATFSSGLVDKGPEPGGISIASQSGAFGAHCFLLARERGYGLNLWATMGNQCDVELSDCLAYMALDPNTDVVMGYMEGIHDAERLMEALRIARECRKPVVLMKVGTSDVGSAAAASHTASLTGSDAVFEAVLKQYDVHRAHSIDEMFDIGYACTAGKFPSDDGLGIITVSGGVGVIMADAASDAGLGLPALPDETQKRLKRMVPFAGTRNPLDVTAQLINDTSLMTPMFDALLGEGGYRSAMCFAAGLGLNPTMMERLMPSFVEVSERYRDRLMVMSILSNPETRRKLEGLGYLVFEDPTRGINAIAAMARFGRAFARTGGADVPPALPPGAPTVERGVTINEFDAKKMLLAAGVPAVDERIATSADDAASAASAIGYPIVMKIVSPDILHKSEIGGVLLNVADEAAVREGFATLMERGRTHAPDARLDGVLLAPMVKDGVETILGVVRDPVFGPVVMFGLGGIFVEVLKDVTFRVAPFGLDVAREMIREVKGFPLLDGARGRPPADVEALAAALAQLSSFAHANADSMETIDVNPFLVRPRGQGGVAVDALIVARER